jgi:Domain of unknown function (DUF4249)
MKKALLLFTMALIWGSCIDRIDFSSPDITSQLVVDGMITDEPGPYTIKLSRTQEPYDITSIKKVSAKTVSIFDNIGNTEVLKEIRLGEYQTNPNGIRGVVGREYSVRIETFDNKIYESIPEKINPAGSIENFYYTFEQFQPESGPTKYQFKFFIDANGNNEGDNLFRWKLSAVYLVETNPELHGPPPAGPTSCDDKTPLNEPRNCSGHIFDNRGLVYIGPPSTCNTCWISIPELKPNISSKQIFTNGRFRNVQVGIVPVDYWVFYDKIHVEAVQLSLTKRASAYWKTVQDQKEGAASLFQPATGKTYSNIYLKNGEEEVQGYFFASAIVRKTLPQKFISYRDIPQGPRVIIPPCPILIKESCLLAFKNSTNQKPTFWE